MDVGVPGPPDPAAPTPIPPSGAHTVLGASLSGAAPGRKIVVSQAPHLCVQNDQCKCGEWGGGGGNHITEVHRHRPAGPVTRSECCLSVPGSEAATKADLAPHLGEPLLWSGLTTEHNDTVLWVVGSRSMDKDAQKPSSIA